VTINFNLSYLVDWVWVPQPPEEIGLLETLEDKVVCDVYVYGVLKFLLDLYHTTPSDLGMTDMLGRLEPVSLEECVEERVASIEEQDERETIYQKHLDAQDDLTVTTAAVTTTAAAVAAPAGAAAAGFDLAGAAAVAADDSDGD